jgi:hypothetical protein
VAFLKNDQKLLRRVEYTSIETDAIINGVKILGDNPGKWAEIKRMFFQWNWPRDHLFKSETIGLLSRKN